MKNKICFKCLSDKPICDYYIHKQMSDGHLNKCKECAKKDSDLREKKIRSENPEWIENEKIRAREKYHRLGYKDKHKQSAQEKKEAAKRYKEKYPEKIFAQTSCLRIKPSIKGNHLHHWSYNSEHYKDVVELSVKDHNKLHRYIVYDQERMMYRVAINGELLDTKEKHLLYIDSIKNMP